MKNIKLATIIIIASLAPACTAAVVPKSLCATNEKIFFSCSLGRKTVSLCASSDTATPEYLEYRFGTPARIELRYRGTTEDSPRKFKRSEITYASNSASIIWFKNAETNYLLHFPADGGPLLEVVKDGETIADPACQHGWADVVGDPAAPSHVIADVQGGSLHDMAKNWGK